MPAGQSTFRREFIERGLEPDQCYWIAHEEQMRAVRQWQGERDPPPDLVLEIEVGRSLADRMSILAALGVPEIWRFDGAALRVHVLAGDGSYRAVDSSPLFPGVDLAALVPFFGKTEVQDSLSVLREFRAWARGQIGQEKP